MFVLLILTAFTAGISGQELDSLKAIMEKKNGTEKAESQEKTVVAPVIVEDNGEEVNVKVMEKEVVKVIESGDSTVKRRWRSKLIGEPRLSRSRGRT